MIYQSAVLSLFRHRTMSRKQQRMPVVSALPTAYFVSGDTGLKQSTEVDWTNKYLNAEELAVIVPIPESVLDDVDYDLWTEIKPLLEEAMAVALDDAVFFGTNAPSSWPTALVTAAVNAANVIVKGASTIDIGDDLNSLMGLVEADGYDVNGFVVTTGLKASLRGLRSTTRELIFVPSPSSGGDATISGAKYVGQVWGEKAYTSKGGFSSFATTADTSHYSAIAGDWDQGIVGIRQDITYKMLDQAIIQDNTGAIIYNLAQQDMVAMRVVMRVAWQVPNPPNRLQPTDASRYPFGVLRNA
jgi:HK97 family phage major capsid protein